MATVPCSFLTDAERKQWRADFVDAFNAPYEPPPADEVGVPPYIPSDDPQPSRLGGEP